MKHSFLKERVLLEIQVELSEMSSEVCKHHEELINDSGSEV